jgi:hypothetical protein
MIGDIERVPYHHVREIEDTLFDECTETLGTFRGIEGPSIVSTKICQSSRVHVTRL